MAHTGQKAEKKELSLGEKEKNCLGTEVHQRHSPGGGLGVKNHEHAFFRANRRDYLTYTKLAAQESGQGEKGGGQGDTTRLVQKTSGIPTAPPQDGGAGAGLDFSP